MFYYPVFYKKLPIFVCIKALTTKTNEYMKLIKQSLIITFSLSRLHSCERI